MGQYAALVVVVFVIELGFLCYGLANRDEVVLLLEQGWNDSSNDLRNMIQEQVRRQPWRACERANQPRALTPSAPCAVLARAVSGRSPSAHAAPVLRVLRPR